MTYKDLLNFLQGASETRLNSLVFIEFRGTLYTAEDLRISNGRSDYLEEDEMFLEVDEHPVPEKK